jgi:hypothetical protein
LARKQVHVLMPEDLHQQVKAKAEEAGVSVTGYLLALVEADLAADPATRSTLSSLALRVRAIELHLGLDSRRPGKPIPPHIGALQRPGMEDGPEPLLGDPGHWDGSERRSTPPSA